MDPFIVAAIAELAKLAFVSITSYMRQAGLTDEQIEEAFQKAKTGMLARDPNKIPD
jgi:hypothetical protein